MNVRGTKIFVGLSGGVDSGVTAALLKAAEAEVTGVFIQGWYPPGQPCSWKEDRQDAMRVAARLRIPFSTLDASREYKEAVIEYLLREYRKGNTPNPDVMCNRDVKFGAFHRYAKAHGADMIATGHYAQTENGALLRGMDATKDQSYFLWAVSTAVLQDVLFPLGQVQKTETRRLAEKFNLPNATKKDSQGVCFLGSISVEEFLRDEFGVLKGQVKTEDGTVVGSHEGSYLHTLGERLALANGPWYVTRKDIETNVLTVAHTPRSQRENSHITLSETNWFAATGEDEILQAQYRYHGPVITGTLSKDRLAFHTSAPLAESIARGQSLVIYRGDVCIGGGIIE